MNDSFRDMIAEGWLIIYMDNLLIASSNLKIHKEHTHHILQRMIKLDLYLKLEKYQFDISEVEYLGIIIKPSQLAMDSVKLDRIAAWLTPVKVKDI